MSEELEPYRIRRTKENPVEVQADDILNAIVKGWDINLKYAKISGNVNIDRIREKLDKDEKGRAVIKGNIRISSSTFSGDAYFISSTFSGYADFSSSTFNRDLYFTGARFERASLFGDIRIKENTMRVAIGNLFRKTKVDDNEEPPEKFFKKIIAFIKNKIPDKIPVTKFYGFDTDTMMDSSSNPLLRRYIDDEQWIDAWKKKRKLNEWILYPIWEISSHCGQSFILLASWALIIASIFGMIYVDYNGPSWLSCIDPKIDFDASKTNKFTPYYYSLVTMFGFGDIKPSNRAGEIWISIEVAIGYVFLGLLISVLANKVARRS